MYPGKYIWRKIWFFVFFFENTLIQNRFPFPSHSDRSEMISTAFIYAVLDWLHSLDSKQISGLQGCLVIRHNSIHKQALVEAPCQLSIVTQVYYTSNYKHYLLKKHYHLH